MENQTYPSRYAFIADDGFVVIFKPSSKIRKSAEQLNAIAETHLQRPVASYSGTEHTGSSMSATVAYLMTCTMPDWHEDGNCYGLPAELFFGAEEGVGNQRHRPSLTFTEIRRAKGICAPCPVRAQCLIWSLENNEEFGVWGGVTKRERDAFWRATGVDTGIPAQRGPKTAVVEPPLSGIEAV